MMQRLIIILLIIISLFFNGIGQLMASCNCNLTILTIPTTYQSTDIPTHCHETIQKITDHDCTCKSCYYKNINHLTFYPNHQTTSLTTLFQHSSYYHHYILQTYNSPHYNLYQPPITA